MNGNNAGLHREGRDIRPISVNPAFPVWREYASCMTGAKRL
jgi:hypothetical protein